MHSKSHFLFFFFFLFPAGRKSIKLIEIGMLRTVTSKKKNPKPKTPPKTPQQQRQTNENIQKKTSQKTPNPPKKPEKYPPKIPNTIYMQLFLNHFCKQNFFLVPDRSSILQLRGHFIILTLYIHGV